MPLGGLGSSPPKPGRSRLGPMKLMSLALGGYTGAPLTSRFHQLSGGNSGSGGGNAPPSWAAAPSSWAAAAPQDSRSARAAAARAALPGERRFFMRPTLLQALRGREGGAPAARAVAAPAA